MNIDMEKVRHLLIIDDEVNTLDMMKAFCDTFGYRASVSLTGEDGLKQFNMEKPDAIICDLKMPGMDGFSVLDIVRKIDPQIPFVVFSGTRDINDAVEALRQGAWDYIIKPPASLELIPAMLERLWERADLLAERDLYQKQLELQIHERTKELEDRISDLKESESQLRSLLRDKEVLLAEVHHRVKNNLQVILILLDLQRDNTQSPEMLEILAESENRIHVMALLQEEFYNSDNPPGVDAFSYFSNIVYHLLDSFRRSTEVELKLDIENLVLEPNKAFSSGLIVNEIFSAIFSLGHHPEIRGVIDFSFHKIPQSTSYEITVKENLSALEKWTPGPGSIYLGYTLMKILVSQVDGEITYSEKTPNELRIKIF